MNIGENFPGSEEEIKTGENLEDPTILELNVPKETSQVGLEREEIRKFSERNNLPEPLSNALELIASELLSNEIRYDKEATTIPSSLKIENNKIIFTIEGEGSGPPDLESVSTEKMANLEEEGGRGVPMIKAIVKEIYSGKITTESEEGHHKIKIEIPL